MGLELTAFLTTNYSNYTAQQSRNQKEERHLFFFCHKRSQRTHRIIKNKETLLRSLCSFAAEDFLFIIGMLAAFFNQETHELPEKAPNW